MDTLMDDALMAKECRTTFPFVLCVLALLILLPMCSSADIICKTCDIAIIDLDYIYDPNISFDSVNVTARLYYVSIPEGRSAEEIIANIRSGWIDITKSKDIPTGTIPDENVSIFFRQLVGGQVYETVPCIKKTNASGMVNCIVQAGQGCGHIIAYYNGSDKYSNYTAMKIYCMRGAVPFGTVVGPECLVIFIFIGLLAAGMYVTGRDPLRAFNITSPSTRRAPTYPDYKYKRPSIDVSRRVIGAGKKGWGFVAGRLASQKAEKINNYINKLVTAGVLSKKDAESMKELAVDERLARLLGQDIKREINKVNLVKMSAEFKMNQIASSLKKVSKEEKKIIEAQLQKAKEERDRAQEAIETYNNLLRAHSEALVKAGKPIGLDEIRELYIRCAEDNPLFASLKSIESMPQQAAYAPMLRAKVLSEEALNSAAMLVMRNIDRLPEDSPERLAFEKYFSTDARDIQFKFMEEKLKQHSPEAYDRYLKFMSYIEKSPADRRQMRDEVLAGERERLRQMREEYRKLKEETKAEIEKLNEHYHNQIYRERVQMKGSSGLEKLEHRINIDRYVEERKTKIKEASTPLDLLERRIKSQELRLDKLEAEPYRYVKWEKEDKDKYNELVLRMADLDKDTRDRISKEWDEFREDAKDKIIKALEKIDSDEARRVREIVDKTRKLEEKYEELREEADRLSDLREKITHIDLLLKRPHIPMTLRPETKEDYEKRMRRFQDDVLEGYKLAAEVSEVSRELIDKYSIATSLLHHGNEEKLAREFLRRLSESTRFDSLNNIHRIFYSGEKKGEEIIRAW